MSAPRAALLAAIALLASASPASAVVRIYSSEPLAGSAAAEGRDLIAAERLALADAGRRVAGHRVEYVPMNDATEAAGRWDPEQVAANARRAARDRRAIAYLGEFNSGASAVSIPITNGGGLLQVSPANSAEQFTRPVTFDPGSPGKYYPSGERTYGRVVPIERVQAAAQATVMAERGATSLYVVDDSSIDGMTVAGEVAREAGARGIGVAAVRAVDPRSADPAAVAAEVAGSGADALFFGGTAQSFAIRLWQEVHAAAPAISLYAPDGVGDEAFAAAIGDGPASVTRTTAVPLARNAYPQAGRRFFNRFRERFGRRPESYAIYGYAAMTAVLDAIAAAGDGDGRPRRDEVVRAFFGIEQPRSVLGRFSIDRFGDTSLTDYGVYEVVGGRLVFEKKVEGQPAR